MVKWGQVLFLAFYEFVEKFIRQVKEDQEVKKIPRNHRYIGRPELVELLKGAKGKKEISRESKEA